MPFTLLSAVAGCRPSAPERSKLWSVRTAEAFDRLIKTGRTVSPVSATSTTVRQNVVKTKTLGGLPSLNVELDDKMEAVVFAQFDSRQTPPITSSNLESFSREFLARATPELKIDLTELKLIEMDAGQPGERIIAFSREINGIPVRDARVVLIYASIGSSSYHLIEVQNRSWGHLKPLARPDGVRLTNEKIAQVVRQSNAKIVAAGDSYTVDSRTKAPSLVPTTWYEVVLEDDEVYTLTFFGGAEPALIEAYPHSVNLTLEANVFQRNWSGERAFFPVPDVLIEGTQQALDSNGALPPGVAPKRIVARSNWVRIKSQSGQSTAYDLVNDGARTVVKLDGENVDSVINVYVALSRVRAAVMKFYSPNAVLYFNKQIAVTTDISKSCNAFYKDLTLNFFGKGGDCANMALVNDVIYHEWGHGLDDFTGPGSRFGGGMTDSAFSEAIGDIVTMFMTRDENMALGFFTNDAGKAIRKLDNKQTYVQGEKAEIHIQGTIVAGAFWELRRRLMNKYGTTGHDRAAKLFFSHLLEAETYLQSYKIVQRLADDDHNPATRHSDWCLVNHAFARKGLIAEDPCQDDYDTSASIGKPEVYVALGETSAPDQTPVFVAAISQTASSVRLCIGSVPCVKPIVLALMRSDGATKFFGPVNWLVKDGVTMTAQVFNSSGQELVRRTVRFRKK